MTPQSKAYRDVLETIAVKSSIQERISYLTMIINVKRDKLTTGEINQLQHLIDLSREQEEQHEKA